MPIIQTYYLDAPTLASATAVFYDAGLTTCAADGYYSDGTITREQVGCVLLPKQNCVTCGIPCGQDIAASGERGVYLLNLDLGSTTLDTGAVVIRFDPRNVPDGIMATYNGVVYNSLSSPYYGLLQSGTPDTNTYIGDSGYPFSIGTSTYSEYLYNGSSFDPTGATETITIDASQNKTTPNAPGSCVMVIPKTTATPSAINIKVVGPTIGTAWDISVSCPQKLKAYQRTTTFAESTDPAFCSSPMNFLMYKVRVGSDTTEHLNLYDWVFEDQFGETVLADGWYRASITNSLLADSFRVENGIIVEFKNVC